MQYELYGWLLVFWLRFTDLLTQEFCPKVNSLRRQLNNKVALCWELRCLSPSRIHSAWITILLLPALIFRVNKYEICIQNLGRGESVNTGETQRACVGRNEWPQSVSVMATSSVEIPNSAASPQQVVLSHNRHYSDNYSNLKATSLFACPY